MCNLLKTQHTLNVSSIVYRVDGNEFSAVNISQTDFNPGHKSNPLINLRDDGQHKGRDFLSQRFRCN